MQAAAGVRAASYAICSPLGKIGVQVGLLHRRSWFPLGKAFCCMDICLLTLPPRLLLLPCTCGRRFHCQLALSCPALSCPAAALFSAVSGLLVLVTAGSGSACLMHAGPTVSAAAALHTLVGVKYAYTPTRHRLLLPWHLSSFAPRIPVRAPAPVFSHLTPTYHYVPFRQVWGAEHGA